MKKQRAMILSACMAAGVCLSACSGNKAETAAAPEPAAQTEATATETTASAVETKAEDTEGKAEDAAILVVSFGTSYNDSRDITIGAVEDAIAAAHPEYEVRRAFTSQIIIDVLKEREGLEIDNVTEALDRAVADGIKTLIVQPTHLMNGLEYGDLVAELKDYEEDFDQVAIGEPLLMQDSDYEAVIGAITKATAEYDDGETAIVFMGHGTEAESNVVYSTLQEKLTAAGYENYYIGTVEASPTLDDIMAAMTKHGEYQKVVLEPLMVVAGDHANNDMAGDEEDSWKTILTEAGYETECLLRGLGELPEIQDIYVTHVDAALEQLH